MHRVAFLFKTSRSSSTPKSFAPFKNTLIQVLPGGFNFISDRKRLVSFLKEDLCYSNLESVEAVLIFLFTRLLISNTPGCFRFSKLPSLSSMPSAFAPLKVAHCSKSFIWTNGKFWCSVFISSKIFKLVLLA